jgi:adenylate kinase family enzyme
MSPSAPLSLRAKLAFKRVAPAATCMPPAMKRVAVFGNAGGGKSTLAKRLSEMTKLPLHPLDLIQFRPGGGAAPHEQYLQAHAELMRREEWIIDGFGCVASAWERFAKADTLVYVDLPLATHHWWVTKRLLQGLFVNPEGWPANSPIWASTLNSYQVLWRCDRGLTPRYRQFVADAAASKRVHHLRSARDIRAFLEAVKHEWGSVGD